MGRNWLCSCFEATPVVVQAISTTSDHNVITHVNNESYDQGLLSSEHEYAHPIDEWMPESAIADVGSELDTINEQGESQCTTLTDARSASKHCSSFLPQPDEVSEALSIPRAVAPAKHWYVNPDYGSVWRLRDSGEQVVFAMDPLRPMPARQQLPSSGSKWLPHQKCHPTQAHSPSRTSITGSSTAYSSVQSEDLSLRATTEPEPHWTADRPYPTSEAQTMQQQPLQTRSSYGEHSALATPSDAHPNDYDDSLSESSPVSADYNFFTSPPMASSMRRGQEAAVLDEHREFMHYSNADAVGAPAPLRPHAASPTYPAVEGDAARGGGDHHMTDASEAAAEAWTDEPDDTPSPYYLHQQPPSILDWYDTGSPHGPWDASVHMARAHARPQSRQEASRKAWAAKASDYNQSLPSEYRSQVNDIKPQRDHTHRQVRRARMKAALS